MSSAYEATYVAINTHMDANYVETDIRWDSDRGWDQGNRTEWLEFFIQDGFSDNISIGSSGLNPPNLRTRHIGFATAHVYVREDQLGVQKRMRAIADAFAAVFVNQYVTGGLTFRAPVMTQGASPNTGFRRLVVQVPFERDTTN